MFNLRPAGCKAAYESADFWKNFTNIIELEPEFEEGPAFEYEGLTYKVIVKGEELAVIASENVTYSGDIVIPSSVDYNGTTYSVTSIGDEAFYYCSGLTSVEIPNSVTSIGNYAFYYCPSLTSLVIPNSVTSIGHSAFWHCSSLTSIQIPNSVTSIGDAAFSGWSSLTSIVIPNSVTSIGYDAFCNCESLTSIVVDAGNTKYDSRNGCNAIIETASNTLIAGCQNTIIPNSVTSIGSSAFRSCISLISIEIPNSVTSIGGRAFAYCSNLFKITCLATNPPTIESDTFSNYSAELYVPIGCKSAYQSADYWKKFSNIIELEPEPEEVMVFEYGGLTYQVTVKGKELAVIALDSGQYSGAVVIPLSVDYNDGITYSVTSIGHRAFADCEGLTSIEIPNSVISIGDMAFSWCDDLISIEIPNSVISVGDNAFSGCSNLTSIEIPNSVTSIGDAAFTDCSSLTSIVVDAGNSIYDSRNDCNAIIETASNTLIAGCQNTIITNSVTSIGQGAFAWCESLTSIEIPNSVTSIGDYAFYECTSLTSIEIPNSVTSIGNYAFQCCTSLTKITCMATTPPTIESDTFSEYSADLYVPVGCISAYQSANYWMNFSNIIEIEEPNVNLFIDDFAINAGEIKELAINLTNEIAFTGFQVDFYMPEGLDVVAEGGNYSFELTDRKGNDHVLSAVKQSNGAIRLLCYSLTNKEFKGNEGALVKFSVKASDDFVGEHEISIKDIEFTQKDETKHELEPTTAKVEGRMLAKSITINKTEVSLEVTQTITLKATVLPESTYNKAISWKSSDETIVTVDENGVVIAVKLGEATITATTTDGTNLSATCKVTVVPTLAETITLDKTEIRLEATETATLVATVLPELTTNKSVTWTSSNEAVATVDVNGVVTAVKVGEAIITATTVDGSNLSASCKVTVKPTLATSISLNMTEVSLKATETVTLVAKVLPELATNKTITWKSSNNDVAIVDENGKVTAIATGEATITATTTDGSNLSASANIVVNPTIAESITLNIESTILKANETIELIANVLPELTTNKSVTWQSSDEAVAIVDTNGLVTAIGVGTATITATTIDGSNLSASCIVTVEATLGDANNDAIINVTDVMTVASYILGQNPDKFIFEAADINKDSKISVTDIVAIVNIILNSEITNEATHYARAAKQQALSSRLFINDCTIAEGETKTIAVNLTNDIAFSGFQADIKLPEGLELCQEDGEYLISLSDRKGNDHVLTSAMRSDGTIRVLSYSMNLKDYAGTEGALIYLTVKASENFVGDYEICINNIIFTQANLTEYSLEPTICHLTGITGVEGIDNEIVVATIGDNIVVKNAQLGSVVNVYSSNGALIKSMTATDGSVVIEAPIKGIYVVAIDGKSFKVMVK